MFELREPTAPVPRKHPDANDLGWWCKIYDHALLMMQRSAYGWLGSSARAALMLQSFDIRTEYRQWSEIKDWAVTDPSPLDNLTRSMADDGTVSFSSDPISWGGTFAAASMVIMVDFLDGDDTFLLCVNGFGGNMWVRDGTFTVTPNQTGWMRV